MPAKALLNELQSLQTFQYWQVENVSCSASSKNVKSSKKANKKTKNAVTSSLLMNNDNEHLVDMNKSDDNVVIVHQSSHDSNSTTDTVKKHPNIDKNKVNLNNEVIIDDDKCICPPFYHEHDDDDDHNSIVCDIVRIRKIIQLTLASTNENRSTGCRVGDERIQQLEKRVSEMESTIQKLTSMLSQLMTTCVSQQKSANKSTPAQSKAKPAPANNDDDDDDVDLFGSDDDEAADELRQKRLDEYAAKKAKKPAAVAKSSVVLDIKPWDDETDMKEMERLVRTVKMDGLVWGASKLVPLAYGIKKLQIVCVIEDEKVSVEELGEKLAEFEDHVQSVDVAAFNKI
ncbi:elongation factor 1-delta-like isoform X1 [Dermatophagoides pteronyssinus]|uniref:elongation factor 1-delta-like isoform X1 n=1 Tax=Dermatophagoides pteronyssinus TaxID=6956 RepID=UPI003F66E30A